MKTIKKECLVSGAGYVAIFPTIQNRNKVKKLVKNLVNTAYKSLTDEQKQIATYQNAIELVAYKYIYASNKELFKSFELIN